MLTSGFLGANLGPEFVQFGLNPLSIVVALGDLLLQDLNGFFLQFDPAEVFRMLLLLLVVAEGELRLEALRLPIIVPAPDCRGECNK
jgi:hypothetical protein